jgi:recombinational DNA repair ATPase RecF
MKLTELTLTNFRSHQKAVLKDLQAVNILTGPNGAGKSTILDAIGFGICGVCRGLDDGGRGAKQLMCDLPGAPKAATSVTFKVEGQEPMSRGLDQGPRSATHTKIISKLGLDEQVLRVLAAPLNLLDLDRRKQEEVFFSLTGSGITAEAVAEALKASGAEHDDPAALTTVEGREDALKYAKTSRLNLKKEIAGMVFTPDAAELPKYDEAAYHELVLNHDELFNDISSAKAEVNASAESSQHLKELLASAEKRLSDLKPGDTDGILSEAEVKDIRDRIEHRRKMGEGLATERQKQVAAQEQVAKIAAEGERVKGLGAKCSECGQKVAPAFVKERLADLNKDWAEAAKVVKQLEDRCQAILKDLGTIDQAALLVKLSTSERNKINAHNYAEQKNALTAEVKDLRARVAKVKVPELDAEALSKAEKELSELAEKVKAMDRSRCEVNREILVNQERTKKEAELEKLEALIKAIGPGGAVQQLMASDGTAEMVKRVQEYAAALGVGEVGIAFGPWQILFRGRDISLASTSEKWRISAAFGLAFAVKARASILCLDGADVLFGEVRDKFQELVFACGLEQVFVACTTEEAKKSAPDMEGLAMFAVSNENGVSKVERLRVEVAA